MKKTSLSARLRYAFDNSMSRGPIALIGWLAALSLAIIAVAVIIIRIFAIAPEGGEPLSVWEAAWVSLMRTLDAGTMGGDAGWGFRFIMFGVTLGGVFVISALIGVLTAAVEGKIEELRKGRSRVLETGHTLILGWSNQIFTIISELAVANANQRRPRIVILAEKDKLEMEDEIRARVGSTGNTRVVCRTGSPIEAADLTIVGVHDSRSVIILTPDGEDADAEVIKTLLAITNNPQRRPEPYHIVIELHDPRNLDVARMVGRDEVEIVLVGDIVARVIAQTCRQSGLSIVYSELLDFGGDEIYFAGEPALIGKTYAAALLAYEDSAIIGLCQAGQARLNPPMDTPIGAADQLIAISEDDDTIRLAPAGDRGIAAGAISTAAPQPSSPERTLLLGWNWRSPRIADELDHYSPAGSLLTVVAMDPAGGPAIAELAPQMKNLTLSFQEGDTTERALLDRLDIPGYQHVILLCYSDILEPQQADARTLITLLHLRDIGERAGHAFSIVSEMLDVRNRALAEATRADDFIVSDKLISLMLTQISENKGLAPVFTDMFDPEGSEIYLKPAGDYVALGAPVNFYTVIEAARRRGETAFGYRLKAQSGDADASYGVAVNPKKSQPITFAADDRIIVLAEA